MMKKNLFEYYDVYKYLYSRGGQTAALLTHGYNDVVKGCVTCYATR